MIQSIGYFLVALKLAGLIRTPSMVAPSLLFHEITSRVPRVKARACSVMSVSLRGAKLFTPEIKPSFMAVGDPATKARRSPARVKENDPAIKLSGAVTRIV